MRKARSQNLGAQAKRRREEGTARVGAGGGGEKGREHEEANVNTKK